MLCESDFSVFFRPPTRVNNAGFPTKFVEAQTAGVPVITNHFSDLEEYVDNGKNGFLANGITKEEIDIVLSQVAHLSKREIEEMHSYTRSLNFFDYRKFKTPLMDYMKQF